MLLFYAVAVAGIDQFLVVSGSLDKKDNTRVNTRQHQPELTLNYVN